MFVIVSQGYVIDGPKPWNFRAFEYTLQNDLEINYSLPTIKNDREPIIINNDVKILYARYDQPSYNSKIEYLDGPFWTFSDTEAVGTFQVMPANIEWVKKELKNRLAYNRWAREESGTTAVIQGYTLTIDTRRGFRDIFLQKYQLMGDSDTVGWKFPVEALWLTLTKADLGIALQAIVTHVQVQFDWEAGISNSIDACTTLAELDAVDIGDPVITEPPVE